MTHACPSRPAIALSCGGERWVVEQATAFADATLLDLSGADDDARRHRCRLLAPFDRPVAIDRRPRIRAATRRRWMRRLNRHRSELCRSGDLRAAAGAAIDLLPFQLEPALALIRGHASRFLLADEVGLGKTIQAGSCSPSCASADGANTRSSSRLPGCATSGPTNCGADSTCTPPSWTRRHSRRSTSTLPFDVNPWDVEPDLNHVSRLPQAARSASRRRHARVGRPDCRRGASGNHCITALRGRQCGGEACAARHPADRHPSRRATSAHIARFARSARSAKTTRFFCFAARGSEQGNAGRVECICCPWR